MRSQFAAVLRDIDGRLPSYFLVKGGRLHPVPEAKSEYERLIQGGYEHIVDGVDYDELDRDIIQAINELINALGQRALLLFPVAVAAIISHEANKAGSKLYLALRREDRKEASSTQEGKRQRRKDK